MRNTGIILLVSLATVFLNGCLAQTAQDLKTITYDDAIEATKRNHQTRFEWRAECRALVNQEVAMWSRQAVLAEGEGNLEEASEYRRKAAQVLNENFPDLVTVQGIEGIVEAIDEGQANVFPLDCFP